MRWSAWILGAVVAGCGGDGDSVGDRGARVRGEAIVGGEIVSTVDGHPILADEVADAARGAPDVPVGVVLRRLQDEALLAAAASRAGLADDPEVRRATRQAMVQQLLIREIEAAEVPIEEAQIEDRLEANLERFETPERRATVHVLAQLEGGATEEATQAARAFIEAHIRRALASEDPAATLLAVRDVPAADLPFEVRVQEVPPLSRRDDADPDYLAAIFALEGEGVVPEPVPTSFGVHAIVVTHVEPATEVSREDALATLRAEYVTGARARRMGALLRTIADRRAVEMNPAAAQAALSAPELLGGGE